jgi:hypothetical protein
VWDPKGTLSRLRLRHLLLVLQNVRSRVTIFELQATNCSDHRQVRMQTLDTQLLYFHGIKHLLAGKEEDAVGAASKLLSNPPSERSDSLTRCNVHQDRRLGARRKNLDPHPKLSRVSCVVLAAHVHVLAPSLILREDSSESEF